MRCVLPNTYATKKWWWPIFIYFFDVTVVNSWILWKKQSRNRTIFLVEFRRKLSVTILKQYGIPSKQGKQATPPINCIRYNRMNHWLRQYNTRRCANYPGKVACYCVKCDVGLHPRCYKKHHLNNKSEV